LKSELKAKIDASVGKLTSEFASTKVKVNEVTSNMELLEKRNEEVASSVHKTDFRLNTQLEETSSMCESRSREIGSEIKSLRVEVLSLRRELSGTQVLSSPGEPKRTQAQQTNRDFNILWSKVNSCCVSGGTITTTSLVTTVSTDSRVITTNSSTWTFGMAGRLPYRNDLYVVDY